MVATRKRQNPSARPDDYAAFRQIDGSHGYKAAVPGGYVDYQVRTRKGGRVSYFNFALAEEMGLIPKGHPHRLTRELRQQILNSFAIQIINEYDMINGLSVPRQEVRPGRYMATRYLQMQHPDKSGRTSGDGRSIWNGQVTHAGVTWDVSSCGTGATCLSPATAIEKKYFMTGDPEVCYGCGHADLHTGLAGAILSEVLHAAGVPTERTLAVIGFGKGLAVNVRAGRNLLRPSHFFLYLRQGNYAALKSAVDFFIDRQAANARRQPNHTRRRYEEFAEEMARTFARSAAIFERNYVFVWMDWDGDNILADGGIIDYGSVRQFGLFHREYRYDDEDRMSTSLPEQRLKARDMVQTFAQVRDFLMTGERRQRSDFDHDPVLALFDETFEATTRDLLLGQIGFDATQRAFLMRYHRPLVDRFQAAHAVFERAKSTKGLYKVPDGVTQDAVYSMRHLLRDLPKHLLEANAEPTAKELLAMMASSFSRRADLKPTPARSRRCHDLVTAYREMVDWVSRHEAKTDRHVLLKIVMRSSVVNREDRLTGNSVLWIADTLAKRGADLPGDQLQALIEEIIGGQVAPPAKGAPTLLETGGAKVRSIIKTCRQYLKDFKDGL